MDQSASTTLLWPFVVYGIAVTLLVGGMLLLSYFLGERHKEPATDDVYEGGVIADGTARMLFPVHFYIIAIFFVIFDIEAVFVISWAISIKTLGWPGYIAIYRNFCLRIYLRMVNWSPKFRPRHQKNISCLL
jgi:NADH-quinone oxidoreductase subunit A